MRAFITKNRLVPFIRKVIVFAVWVTIWQLVYAYVGKDVLVASPGAVFLRIMELIVTKRFWIITFNSVMRILSGFFLGLVSGTLLAVITAKVGFLYELFYPLISIIRSTPVASFIILALIWIKSSNVPVFIVFLMVMPIAWANISQGIKEIDVKLLEMAKVFEFGFKKVCMYIYIPSVMPYFVTAVTTGLGLSWKAGIAAEVISVPKYSIGSELYDGRLYLETADLFAWTVVIILLSLLFEYVFVLCVNTGGRRVGWTRWK